MVDVMSENGTESTSRRAELPEVITISASDASRVPSPGTLRTLKAQTGKEWDEMMGPNAESADRFQTTIWARLRRQFPDLAWDDCDDVELIIEGGAAPLEESVPVSDDSLRSVGSGD